MPDQIERAFRRLEARLPGRVSLPGGVGYAAATAIFAKPVGPMPRAVTHRRTTEDVQLSIAIARDCGLPLSVRGGGITGPAARCAAASSSISAA
jgi:FAD/FMN-containing dehydrogenase